MAGNQPALLVVSGPVGVGKTTIGSELSSILERRLIAHSFVDLDGLAQTYPRKPDDPFGNNIALSNLSLVWANCRKHGSKNLIVGRVVETKADVEKLGQATGISKITVCQLCAPDSTLLTRVRSREIGSDREWHERRSLELAGQLEQTDFADFLVNTEAREPTDIAQEVAGRVGWAV